MTQFKEIVGKVVGGQRIGRKLGFPTANIAIQGDSEESFGVYFARVLVRGSLYYGVLSLGRKSTVSDDYSPTAEIYIFDFASDIYGEELVITPLEYLRGQQKFDSVESLKAQITKDVEQCKTIINQKLF